MGISRGVLPGRAFGSAGSGSGPVVRASGLAAALLAVAALGVGAAAAWRHDGGLDVTRRAAPGLRRDQLSDGFCREPAGGRVDHATGGLRIHGQHGIPALRDLGR